MRWECCECGAVTDELPAPSHCEECGIAGGGFVPAEPDEMDAWIALWLREGLERRIAPPRARS